MATKKKLLQAAAGNAGGAGLDVDEVFSTYLYTGTGSTQTITNGIDLAGEGGLVWLKSRNGSSSAFHIIYDTERGTGPNGGRIFGGTASTNGADTQSDGLQSFNSNGFTLGANLFENGTNASYGTEYCSWTFRKAPKFFDVVTYTGDGTTNRQIPHSIDGPVGFILIKRTDSTGNWLAWHRSVDPGYGILDLTLAFTSGSNGFLNAVADTYFETSWLNTSGATYVAYLFAHNDGDGEFGPDGDADIVKCGSYTGNGSSNGPVIDLGFEPQWVMIKRTDSTADWVMQDVMRGMIMDSGGAYIKANDSAAEFSTTGYIQPEPSGFKVRGTGSSQANASGGTYIYIAIRRGPLAPPESATDVFAIDTQGSTGDGNEPSYRTTFPVDMVIQKATDGGNGIAADRLRGTKRLFLNDTSAETSYSSGFFDYMNGWRSTTSTYAPSHAYMWKRAPNYMDCVAYSGNYTARTIAHNLTVPPEMMWVKKRSGSADWTVYHKDLGATKYIEFNTYGAATNSARWNNTAPTSSVFTLGDHGNVNATGDDYIAYLFSTLDGISKVGSYTGNGSSMGDTQTIDCGFSSGARFVLIKRTSGTGAWYLFDTERGIVSGTDKYLTLNSTAAEVSGGDYIDPDSSGFIVVQHPATETNTNGETYIFYAIA